MIDAMVKIVRFGEHLSPSDMPLCPFCGDPLSEDGPTILSGVSIIRAGSLVGMAHTECVKSYADNPGMKPEPEQDAALPCNKIKNVARRARRAGRFGENTCPASRHVLIMADRLCLSGGYSMFIDEPKHCAASLYSILESLWKARDQLNDKANGKE